MAIKVYVAGGSGEREKVAGLIEALRAAGVEVTYDWTRSEGYSRPMNVSERREQARLDLEAVRAAEIVWVVAPEAKSEGAAVEMGYAFALRKRVIVSGPHARRVDRLFALIAEIHDDHAAAFGEIVAAGRMREHATA